MPGEAPGTADSNVKAGTGRGGTHRVRSVVIIVIRRSLCAHDIAEVAHGWMSDSRQFWSARAGIVEGVSQNSTITSGVAALDDERRYQAAVSKDPRFDGVFFIAVTSTGIYCRPSCPAITPKRQNMRFYRSAAAGQGAGFRACKRCRPDASPGSP